MIPGIPADEHQQTSIPGMNLPFLSHTHEIPAVLHHCISPSTHPQHWTYMVLIAGWLATRATGSYAQQDSSWVDWASWLLRMPFWLEANYIFLSTSHIISWSSSSGLVLATDPGNPPAVRGWTAKTGRFGSRPVPKPNLLTLRRPNPDPYPSTSGFRRPQLD